MKITTLCENRIEPSFGLFASHGLSLHIEYKGKQFLYDVGQDIVFMENAEKLHIDIDNCKTIIISHGHFDHAGGLCYLDFFGNTPNLIIKESAFLEKIRLVNEEEVDIGISNSLKHLKEYSKKFDNNFEIFDGLWCISQVEINKDFVGLEKGLYIKNEDGSLEDDTFSDELGLCCETREGLCVISGCSHRGVINIINAAKELMKNNSIHTFIGGLHLNFASEKEIYSIINAFKELNIKRLIIGHCTGWKALNMIERELSPKVEIINNYVGYSVKL